MFTSANGAIHAVRPGPPTAAPVAVVTFDSNGTLRAQAGYTRPSGRLLRAEPRRRRTAREQPFSSHGQDEAQALGPYGRVGKMVGLDDRLGVARVAASPGQDLPDHWSFMLGEIALYSFVV